MVPRFEYLALALAAFAAAPASAQDARPLVVRTAHVPTAQRVLAFFEHEGPLPALTEGGNWRMTLGMDGALQIETDDSLISPLQIGIRPNELMAVYPGGLASAKDELDQAIAQLWRDAGLVPVETSPLLDFVAGLAEQVAHVRLRFNGDLDDPVSDLNMQAWFRPLPDTWLETFVKKVRPLGMPTVRGLGGGNALALRLAVKLEEAEEVLEPIYGLLTSGGASSPEEAARLAAASHSYWRALDGTMVAAWNASQGSMLSVVGLRAPARVREAYESPVFAKWMASTRATPSGFEVEFTPDAVEVGGARLWKSVVRPSKAVADALPDAFLQEEIVCHGGVVRSYLIHAIGVEQSALEDVVKRANNHAFPRNILQKMVYGHARIWTAELLSARADRFDLDRLPKTVAASLGSTGELLFLTLRLQ